MVLGPLSVVAAATLYHGVRESVKYLYIPPAIRSRIENYDWETYRFRMPSPGNDLINNEKAARELHKDHFKASYHLSTYYVRGITQKATYGFSCPLSFTPNIANMKEADRKKFLNLKEGEDYKQNKLYQTFEHINQKQEEEYKEFHDQQKECLSDVQKLHTALQDLYNESQSYSSYIDEGEYDQQEYLIYPDTYLAEYDNVYMNSFDMQLHLEAERLIEEKVDKLHKKGYKDRKGSSDRFKILDSSHRKDQVDQTVQLLKQRNVKE